MKKKKVKEIGITALYERLSRDDDGDGDSNSIVHQKQMLETYAKEHGFINLHHYTDDGWSGASFDRPAWNELVSGVKDGKITTVIVKDLSRVGRDHLQVGFFTDILFREKEVRFIAVGNSIDSNDQQSNEFAPFLNIMNEWYVRDTSKKIKAVLKSRGMSGKAHTSNSPCYGYVKDPENPDHWVVDEEAAAIVRRIFQMSINDERYLHLRENGAGVGFATYNKITGEPLESGQISEKNLPPDGRNAIPAARNWYLFELSDDDRKAIQQESVKILENIPQAGIGRRRIWEPETLPKDIRLINSHYDDLYRIPDGGVVQVDYPDGRSFTARLEHLDDYHFDMGGLGNVLHICQFAEVMERNHADFYPEIQTQDEQAAWELGGKGYLAIQSCEDGWDYTIYHSDYSVMDGGQLGAPELTIQEAREQILEAHHMEKGRRLLQDYDAVMDKVAEAEELSADHRPSTLEKLAELASDTSAPKSSARSAPEL